VELTIFGRFHARPGQAKAVAAALREVVPPSRAEPDCLRIEAFRSTQDPDLFFINSVWTDEAAFERHAGLPHTVAFLAKVAALTDHPPVIARSRPLVPPA
jgi:quinol monooxygenase YgiN